MATRYSVFRTSFIIYAPWIINRFSGAAVEPSLTELRALLTSLSSNAHRSYLQGTILVNDNEISQPLLSAH